MAQSAQDRTSWQHDPESSGILRMNLCQAGVGSDLEHGGLGYYIHTPFPTSNHVTEKTDRKENVGLHLHR